MIVNLDVDTNRNGVVEADADEEGEHTWTKTRGAIFSVNYDRDGTRTHPTSGLPILDSIHIASRCD
jgi:hypothetical protein